MSNLKKVLIVDDLASWQDSLAGLLSDIGCILEFAATVPDAKQRLQSSKFDLCIIDIRLQEDVDYDVGGIDLLEWLHKHKNNQPPAIILTGHGTEALRQKAVRFGVFAFLEKSSEEKGYNFDKTLFIDMVKEAMDI
ncbi:MAG: response regulator [Calditrichaeota bacterium]|nr:response regulator [Calditrichota bacterium]MCB0294304.1 response regulator [Calditrichota bacterium]MCB0304070.1 response regulator [Calditrichota bacterium]